MDFLKFFNGIVGKKDAPEPIKAGDTCRNKDTGDYSVCKKVMYGMYYGKDASGFLVVGIIDNFEKV